MQNQAPQNPQLAAHYEYDAKNPYAGKGVTDEFFNPVFEKVKQYAIGLLCQLDPTKADLYKSNAERIFKVMETEGCYKQMSKDFFAGCQDATSPMFEGMFKGAVGKTSSYFRFLLEREMYKEELDKIEIKKPLVIVALPRSGTTFTQYIFNQDPNAQPVAMYEHLSAGSKTMALEGREAFAHRIIDPVESHKDLDSVHAVNDCHKPEEDLFFMEMLGHTLIYSTCMPRLEEYRVNIFERDNTWLYDDWMYELKMHMMEFPLKENQYLCLKSTSHFLNPFPFFFDFGTKTDARFIWIHRDPISEIKSYVMLSMSVHENYKNDIGYDDIKWLNENIIRMNITCFKNAIKARDEWVKEDPKRAKQIYDVGFEDMIKHPVESTKKIYEYFGMEFKEGFDKMIDEVCNEKHPQHDYGRKKVEEQFIVFDEEDVRKRFQFYYERFADYLPKKN